MEEGYFGTKEEILARLEAFRKFNEWEMENIPDWSPEQALALTDELYSMMPEEARMEREDPTYEGARWMMSVLARLK
ncbi:MAG: hypothetical protein JO197_21795 [Acidobacteria bacterium]|nr:hypothetical protein [Acidobacteriota bacterium]MBV9474768.1 hypothetical protein [Acidobacteriota bacterium]